MSHQFGAVHPNDPPEIRDRLLSEQDLELLRAINEGATFHECRVVSYDPDVPARRSPLWWRRALLGWPEGPRGR
jgi:hypothetical protein